MKKLSVIFLSVIAGISLSGCGKSYLDINTPNPNAATSATPELVITNAMTVTASFQVTTPSAPSLTPILYVNGWMGYWGQSGSYATSNTDMSSYNETTNYANNLWITAYRNLEDYYYVETSAKEQVKPYYEAMAKTMKSLVFGELVDLFNNIPYTQAFQGTAIIQPTYDKGQDVYDDLVKQCDTAVNLFLSPAAVASDNTDIMFEGDQSKWAAFANTLKLRLLMRQTQIPGRDAYITDEINKILANGAGFLDVDAAVNPGYANNDQQQNPFWGFFVTLKGLPTAGGGADLYRAGQYSITILQSLNDPRISLLYDTIKGGSYKGSILGDQFNPPGSGTSTFGPGLLKSVDQNAIILSAAESHFLQAEAMVRGYIAGGAAAAKLEYEAGVLSSFLLLGDDAGYAAYISSGNPQTTWNSASGTSGQIALIIRQKWISENGFLPLEAYADYRRLHLPADLPISVSPYKVPADAQVPVRFLYPVSEYTTNTTNVNAEGNIDYYTSKVFWNQ